MLGHSNVFFLAVSWHVSGFQLVFCLALTNRSRPQRAWGVDMAFGYN